MPVYQICPDISFQSVKPSRVRLTADRGFADEPLFALLQQLRVRFAIRVKGRVKVCFRREWRKLNRFGFHGNSRYHTLGQLRVASRRRGRCELSLVSAILSLLQQDRGLLACLLSFTKFKLNATLDNVS